MEVVGRRKRGKGQEEGRQKVEAFDGFQDGRVNEQHGPQFSLAPMTSVPC